MAAEATGFLYFLDNMTGGRPTPDELIRNGLPHLNADGLTVGACIGPSGQRGLIVADSSRLIPGELKYDSDIQTWLRIPGDFKNPSWVGMYSDRPPGPDVLRKESALQGTPFRLLDGNSWEVPVALAWEMNGEGLRRRSTLPFTIGMNDAGEYTVGEVQKSYRKLSRIAEWFISAMSDDVDSTPKEEIDAAVEALSFNYCLGPVEAIGLLQLFGDTTAGEVLLKVVDWDSLSQIPLTDDHKKKA